MADAAAKALATLKTQYAAGDTAKASATLTQLKVRARASHPPARPIVPHACRGGPGLKPASRHRLALRLCRCGRRTIDDRGRDLIPTRRPETILSAIKAQGSRGLQTLGQDTPCTRSSHHSAAAPIRCASSVRITHLTHSKRLLSQWCLPLL
jgi:hypothetical protein